MQHSHKSASKKLGSIQRQSVSITQENLIKVRQLDPDRLLPVIIEPGIRGIHLIEWASNNRQFIEEKLLKHGGIIFNHFEASATDFEKFMYIFSDELLEDPDRIHTNLQDSQENNVYVSTQFPATQTIFFHNETWWQYVWPMHIYFFGQTIPPQGGATTICDCREVYKHIEPSIIDRFNQKKILHVRNFGPQISLLPWQRVFGTKDRAEVEDFCRKHEVEYEWKAGDRLTTRHIRPAIVTHPQTGELLWFNHVAHYHITTNTLPGMEDLVAEVGEENITVNTYYGDGRRIEDDVIVAIRAAYHQAAIEYPWEAGNVMMLDNMLAAHGRSPYQGPRKILVGMTDLVNWTLMK